MNDACLKRGSRDDAAQPARAADDAQPDGSAYVQPPLQGDTVGVGQKI